MHMNAAQYLENRTLVDGSIRKSLSRIATFETIPRMASCVDVPEREICLCLAGELVQTRTAERLKEIFRR